MPRRTSPRSGLPSRRGPGNWLRPLTALLGLLLLGFAVGSLLNAQRAVAMSELDHRLASEATYHSSALSEYFDRARSVDLLLAQQAAFAELEPNRSPPARRQEAAGEAAGAMANLESLYEAGISEACLVDESGHQLVRVVRGEPAPPEQLSATQADTSYFARTLQLPPGAVYQSTPYRSGDTGLWVVANATPLASAGGHVWGFVHVEVSLESFPVADSLQGRHAGIVTTVVDNRTGRVLLEPGRSAGVGPDSRQVTPAMLELLKQPALTVASTVTNHRVAVERVSTGRDNANSWSVVSTSTEPVASWTAALTGAPLVLGLSAVLLLGLVGVNLRASNREQQRRSLSDELTGLPNRRLLASRLDAQLTAGLDAEPCTVLLLDLDRFKQVNDTMGHHYGDALLKEVASRLQTAFRTEDVVARLGGDEFAVLLPGIADEGSARALAGRCTDALHEPFLVEGVLLTVAASVGVALAPLHGTDANAVLRAADVAMYAAKDRKAGVVVYDEALDVNTPARLALHGDLRRALREGELFLAYQPKVDLATGRLSGVEALVRWRHPERGLLPPDEFIPVAEATGLILPLTLLTLDLAVAQVRGWLDAGESIQTAVNLSPRCLMEPDFPALVHQRLREQDVPAHLLRLEITEYCLMADPKRAIALLTALRDSGIALSIDDFGTGFSSLSYLKGLPVDELKIDRSFVTDMLDDVNDAVLVRSAIDLGHNLGLTVLAEGVEDAAVMQALARLGCDVVQGYHLGRPMPAADLDRWRLQRDGAPAVHSRV